MRMRKTMRYSRRLALQMVLIAAVLGTGGCGTGIRVQRSERVSEVFQLVGQARLVNKSIVEQARQSSPDDRRLRDKLKDAVELLGEARQVNIALVDALGSGGKSEVDRILREKDEAIVKLRKHTFQLWNDVLRVQETEPSP